jgi:hypothetical protein
MKNLILTLLDFVFVLLVIALGIVLIYVFNTNQAAVQSWIDQAQSFANDLVVTLPKVVSLPKAGEVVTTEIPDFFHIEKRSLVDDLPLSTQAPTTTPIPDPVSYRNEVILRTKNFANTLESFFGVNERLRADPNLLHDEAWRKEVRSRLDLFAEAGVDMGKVKPAPGEYAAIQAVLEIVGPHAQNLRDQYLLGIETEDREMMKKASSELDQIYDAMNRLQSEMIKAGWQP